MAKFCGKCGSPLEAEFGLCPNCDRDKLESMQIKKNTPNFCTICGAQINKETGECPVCTDLQENEQVEAVEKKENADASPKGKRFKTVFITVLASILLFLYSVLSIFIFCVRSVTTSEGAEEMLSAVNFSDLMDMVYEIPADGYSSSFYSFRDFLYDTAGVWITQQQFDSFVDNSTVKRFVARKIAEYANGIYTGSCYFSLNREDVYELLQDNNDVFYDEFGVSISNDMLNEIADWIIDDEALAECSLSAFYDDNPVLFNMLRFGFSYITLAVLLLLCLLWIFILFRNNLSQGALGAGIVFATMGSLLTVSTLMTVWFPSLLNALCGNELVGWIIGKFLYANIALYSAVLAIGVLLLALRKIVIVITIRRKEG